MIRTAHGVFVVDLLKGNIEAGSSKSVRIHLLGPDGNTARHGSGQPPKSLEGRFKITLRGGVSLVERPQVPGLTLLSSNQEVKVYVLHVCTKKL
jgi:hypothetical protein